MSESREPTVGLTPEQMDTLNRMIVPHPAFGYIQSLLQESYERGYDEGWNARNELGTEAMYDEGYKRGARDEWERVLKAEINHSGSPAPFNPEGLPIKTSQTIEMTRLLHEAARQRLAELEQQ